MTEKKGLNGFNPDISIGIVGYGPVQSLNEIQAFFSQLPDFHIVYIKTSSDKLWIKEGMEK